MILTKIKAKLTQSLHRFSKGGNREYHLSLWCGWAGGNKLTDTERLTLLQKGLNWQVLWLIDITRSNVRLTFYYRLHIMSPFVALILSFASHNVLCRKLMIIIIYTSNKKRNTESNRSGITLIIHPNIVTSNIKTKICFILKVQYF